ncbi:MAG: GNAT family N-acetyltransferase [Bacteroidaceae bacterium]|nr:GNAT family N-acetyltransferase [Bacteroidaceae bacterium]
MENRLTLRALEPEDLDLVHRIENDATLWAWGASCQPLSRYTIRQYLSEQHADIYQDGQLRLVIEVDGKSIGMVDLSSFCPHHLRAEVGIVILHEYHRQGWGTETLRQLADYSRQRLHLCSLYAYVAEMNTAGQNLFRTAGYRPVGQLDQWIEGEHKATLFQKIL